MTYSALSHLECPRCGARHDADQVQGTCSCGSPLLARYDPGQPAELSLEYPDALTMFQASVQRNPDGDFIRYWKHEYKLFSRTGIGMEPASPIRAMTQAWGLDSMLLRRPDAPAGSSRDDWPTVPVTPYGSLPVVLAAPPPSDQPAREPSKLPPGTSSYELESPQAAKG